MKQNKNLADELMVTAAYVMMFLVIDSRIGWLVEKIPLIFLIGGAILLLASSRIAKDQKWVQQLVQLTAYIILFLGFKFYLKPYSEAYSIIIFILGALIYTYHHAIIQKLFGGEMPTHIFDKD